MLASSYLYEYSVWMRSPARKLKLRAGNVHGLRPQALQVYFDAPFDGVVEGFVREAREIEIGIEFAVHAAQQIQRECRGHTGGVVVGIVQAARILFQVGAQHQSAVATEQARARRKKAVASSGSRLPIVEPGKKPSRRSASSRPPGSADSAM